MTPRAALAAGLLAGAAFAAGPAAAADLVETYRAAQQADPDLAVARASLRTGEARRALAGTLWKPSVVASGAAGVAGNDTRTRGASFSAPGFGDQTGVAFRTSVTAGPSLRWSVAARQPLLDRGRDAQVRQLELASDAAALEWQAAQQALMLRTAQRYLDVALAQESVRVLGGQRDAALRALAEARDRYALGDAPVTGTHEAQARAQAVAAQLLAAESELEVRRAALADLTGGAPDARPVRIPGAARPAGATGTLEEATARVARDNLSLRMLAIDVDVARAQAVQFTRAAAPSADLVAQVAREQLSGHGDYGAAGSSATTTMIGVQLSVPLYTGGQRDARLDEATRVAEKAAAQLESARRQAVRDARAAWHGLAAGEGRIAALEAALDASRARLAATQLGRDVGDRTTLDLLNAQNDLAQADLALSQARAARVLDALRLAALESRLDEDALRRVDATLAQAPAR